jgi:hypothetical protein
LQLTRLTAPGLLDAEYRYSATQNNGQITQMKDWISGVLAPVWKGAKIAGIRESQWASA